MALFRHFSRKFSPKTLNITLNNQCAICVRFLNHSPMLYDEDPDPSPVFIKQEVQSLLKTLTRVDLAKVFRKRQLGEKKLSQPEYKFMTDEQLKEALDEAKSKVESILQIPPVVPVRKPRNKILSKDPALQGLDTSAFVFTDITFGVRDSERIILIRDTEGTLKEADWETRDRVNHMYFPAPNRHAKIPKMFEDSYLQDLLKKEEYNFILDRACWQFEPNDPLYQKVVSITYQEINDKHNFNSLRSTRHFGSFVFFLSWHKMIDNLLLDLIENEYNEEADALVKLYSQIHNIEFASTKDFKAIEEYINKHSTKKGALELSLQAYKNALKQRQDLEAGIKRAHGIS